MNLPVSAGLAQRSLTGADTPKNSRPRQDRSPPPILVGPRRVAGLLPTSSALADIVTRSAIKCLGRHGVLVAAAAATGTPRVCCNAYGAAPRSHSSSTQPNGPSPPPQPNSAVQSTAANDRPPQPAVHWN